MAHYIHALKSWGEGKNVKLPAAAQNLIESRDVLGRRMTRVHVATYAAIHLRLQVKERGLCVRCDHPAEEWALKIDASERLTDKNSLLFSTHESDYEPLCRKCHRNGDGNSKTAWARHHDHLVSKLARGLDHVGNSKLTLEQVAAIKKRRAEGETGRALSKEFNISEGTISMIASGKRWNTKLPQLGFSLIEILIVVSIIGVLLAIALPTYQDYAIRAKVTEGMNMASAAKLAVIETAATNGLDNVTQKTSGYEFNAAALKTAYVESVKIADGGAIAVVTKNTGAKAEPAFTLTPVQATPDDQIQWVCTLVAGLAKHVPATCRTPATPA